VTQSLDGIELGCAGGGIKSENDARCAGGAEGEENRNRRDDGFHVGELGDDEWREDA